MAAIIALAPLILELIKLLFGKDKGDAAIKQAEDAIRRAIQEIRAAIDEIPEKGTGAIEDIINRPKK